MKKRILLAAMLALLAADIPVRAAELFVSKSGADSNSGHSKATAFLTIGKGVRALKPGDTLTIAPGEYVETIKLHNFGDLGKETLIRAEIPGTVALRGDRNVDMKFTKAPGYRFVYVADCKQTVLSAHEADTVTNLAQAANIAELDFGPARYIHDAKAGKLYISSSDLQAADRHRYTIGVLKGHGFHMFKCKRVVLDGIAFSGYRTPDGKEILLLPTSGVLMHQTQKCIVRRCVAFFNNSGITINSGIGSSNNQPGEGRGNVIEDCVAYANMLDGIVGNNSNNETIRNCRTFRNETYGARFYAGLGSDDLCLMENVISWGNPGGDFWVKGVSHLSAFNKNVLAEKCVAFRGCMWGNFQHGLVGGGTVRGGNQPTTVHMPPGHENFLRFLDENFADAVNMDFRPQATSSLRDSAPKGSDYMGPHPYKPNIFYVKPGGSDSADGLSMNAAWRTLGRAIKKLKSGETLYIASGEYAGGLTVSADNVSIRGRGIKPVAINGDLRLNGCRKVSISRLQFGGVVDIAKGEDIELSNCVFAGSVVRAQDVRGLEVSHNVLAGPLSLSQCSNVAMVANLNAAAPAVETDSLDAVVYSSYNSYSQASRCWKVAGRVLSLKDLQPQHDAYSVIQAPELRKAGGVTIVQNEHLFGGRGPHSTAIGPHREWKPKQLAVMGPFVESRGRASADIEWWTTLPVQVELRWGDTPECANRKTIMQRSFYSYSLTGLKPGKKYYVQVVPTSVSVAADPGRRFVLSGDRTKPISFTTSARAHKPATYYVAVNGNDDADGLTPKTAWKSLQVAANRVGPGDTVLLTEGEYPGTFYFRSTGEADKPITFKAAPGAKVVISGKRETLKAALVFYGKHHYRLDGLYVVGIGGLADNIGGKEAGGICARDSADLQVSRCEFARGWGRCMDVRDCPGFSVRNSVIMAGMEAVMIYGASDTVIENCVFIGTIITNLHVYAAHGGKPNVVRRNIFGENTRHKVHICTVQVSANTYDNCFFMRLVEQDRKTFNGKTLPEHRDAGTDGNSLFTNPFMRGAVGFRSGWQRVNDLAGSKGDYDPVAFNSLFSTNPELIVRDIGLQAEAFEGMHFWKKNYPFTRKWAAQVKKEMDAAEKLSKDGKNAQAAAAYVKVVKAHDMSDQLKSDLLDRAAQSFAQAGKYKQAMNAAQGIPIRPYRIRRQMAILFVQKKYTELIKSFSDKAMAGHDMDGWVCPDNEMVMADAYYYRGIAYAETGDMKAATADMERMITKGKSMGYSPGKTILELAQKRLDEFKQKYNKSSRSSRSSRRR